MNVVCDVFSICFTTRIFFLLILVTILEIYLNFPMLLLGGIIFLKLRTQDLDTTQTFQSGPFPLISFLLTIILASSSIDVITLIG